MTPSSVAVVGAGLSGLSCARSLADAGVAVEIFEKSRSLAGRCATRRWEGHVVDHGAQYFTITDEGFRGELQTRCGEHLRILDAPIIDADGREIPARHPRWYHAQGNNRLGQALGDALPVRREAAIDHLEKRGRRWLVGGREFDAVVISAPLPQTLALMGRASGAGDYAPCLAAFFSYQGEWAGKSASCYARRAPAESLAWSACENHKMGRIAAGQTVFVAHASAEFSVAALEEDPLGWSEELRQRLEECWELSPRDRVATFTHRWRYARCERTVAPVSDLAPGLHATGDAFTKSRVESAWLAGRATAETILSRA